MDEDEQLPHLETFTTAAELGSFTAAAKSLGLTQSAVSQRIHSLEQSLDTNLFHRHGGRVALTDAGRTLHAFARQIHALHRQARQQITGHDAPLTGELAIAASTVPGEHLLPMFLTGFGWKHPHIRVRAAICDSLAVLAQLERGEASLGFMGQKVEKPHLEFRHLARDRIVFVSPPGHPLLLKKRVTLDQLARYPLVVREAGSGLRHCFENALEQIGRSISDFPISLELGSNEAIKEAVLRGSGIAVLSALAVNKELESGRLRAIPVKGLHCDREIYTVQDLRRALPVPAQLFLQFIEANPIGLSGS